MAKKALNHMTCGEEQGQTTPQLAEQTKQHHWAGGKSWEQKVVVKEERKSVLEAVRDGK